MEVVNLLHFDCRAELRLWLEQHHTTERECWIVTKEGRKALKLSKK